MTQKLYIQPYAHVLVLDPDKCQITAYSDNLPALLGAAAGAMLLQDASLLFTEHTLALAMLNAARTYPAPVSLAADQPFDWGNHQLLPRMVAGRLLLEIEPVRNDMSTSTLQGDLLEFSDLLKAASSLTGALTASCERIAATLGFDRVNVYQFDQASTAGRNVAESSNGRLPSLLNVHFREADFPVSAHNKLRLNPVIVFGPSSPESPAMDGDLSGLASTVNYELGCRTGFPNAERYLRENDLATQLNITLTIGGRLWGTVLGHSASPRYLDQQQRRYARLVGTQLEREISNYAQTNANRKTLIIDGTRAKIRQQISKADDLQQGLTAGSPSLIDYLSASTGAAVLVEDKLSLIGDNPGAERVTELLTWAAGTVEDDDLFVTDRLRDHFPTIGDVQPTDPAGVLLAPLDKRRSEWIAWFRPEWVAKVEYGSRQLTPDEPGGKQYVTTQETRRGYSLPWSDDEIAVARELQSYVREVVVEKYGQLKRVNRQLKIAYDEMEAFSYTVSHDLRAPLRGIDGFAEILVEDYGKELSLDAAKLVTNIQENAARMNQFISDILELSRVGRSSLIVNDCDVNRLVNEAVAALMIQKDDAIAVTVHESLPPINGDYRQLKVVFYHLLSNAIKYSAHEPVRHIEVGFRKDGHGGGEFFVADDGIGIAPQHHQRIFGMFNRLVTSHDFEGNGVGLAIVRRIIHRHHGEIRVESEPGRGSTFYFYTNPVPAD